MEFLNLHEFRLRLIFTAWVIAILCSLKFSCAELNCDTLISNELREEIKGYQEKANKIIDTALSGDFKGRTYKNLAAFVDKFGSRFAGTDNLERAIDYMLDRMKENGLANVNEESFPFPYWNRGEEEATLLSPRNKTLKILGLGLTIATPPEGITAPAIVVKTFDELQARASEVKGKIVVYNQDYGPNYFIAYKYRTNGPGVASRLGAVACLIRSITPFSINSPHTGALKYENDTVPIPASSITVEDAELLYRLEQSGEKLTINLKLGGKYDGTKTTRNIMGDITGSEKPDTLVLLTGHVDSWDVGEGAMDDAGGCVVSMEAQNLLNHLKLKPRRTLRTVLFSAEEPGIIGAKEYIKKHKENLGMINAMMESDFGTFKPTGLDFAGLDAAACIVQEVLTLLKSTNATLMRQKPHAGGDTIPFVEQAKVPAMSLRTDEEKYMWFHHTEGDTMSVEDPDELDLCLAVWTVASYVIADLSVDLPRA